MGYLENEVLDIVRHALRKESYQKSLSNEKEIFTMIFENGLNGLAYSVIDKHAVSNIFYKRLENTFFEYVSKDEKQQAAIKEIREILNQHDIDFIFMKGTVLKNLYPESYMRAMGDIDLLIKESDLKRIHQVFSDHQIKCTLKSKQHDGFLLNGLMIEVHPGLYKDFNPKYALLFSNPWKYSYHVNQHEYAFTHEFEICYLLYHLAKHMDSSGVGLRSVLDLGVYVNHFKDELQSDLLYELLTIGNMSTFYHVMMEFNKQCFGITTLNEDNPNILTEDEMNELITYITKSGIHGLGSNYNAFSSKVASSQMKGSSKFKFMISLFFPDYESMKGMYPWSSKSRILIIPAWIIRWIKLIFKTPKMTYRKLKKLKTPENEVKESRKIFEMIGLK